MFVTIADQSPDTYNYFDDVFRFVDEDLKTLLGTVDAVAKFPYMFSAQQLRSICFKMRSEYGLFRHYYRDYAIPAASAMAERLERDYQKVQEHYSEFVQHSGYFDLLMKDVIQAGYVTINHKLESFVAFLTAHAKGKAYGPMDANTNRAALYEEILRNRYNILFDDFLGREPVTPTLCNECDKPVPIRRAATARQILYPRIQRIRLIANRVKHQSGYPKSDKDPLLEALNQEVGKPIGVPMEEFLYDLAYGDAYLYMLTNLINSAYTVGITEHVLAKPPTEGQEEYRPKIEKLLDTYKAQLETHVNEYNNLRIDQLKLAL